MPILIRNNIDRLGEYAIWKVTESPAEMMEVLKSFKVYADIPFFRNPKRLAEWLAVRVLFAELGIRQRIVYDESGKPHLEGEGKYVSISHSGEYVGVIYHTMNKVGIDIEKTGDRIFRVSHKFVNDKEQSWISVAHEMQQLYIIWGAKECAFKIYGSGAIDFRDHLEVQPFDFKEQGETSIRFMKNPSSESYLVHYLFLNDVMITYAIAS